MPEPMQVYIADDHAVVRAGVRQALDRLSDVIVCGDTADATTLLADPRLATATVLVLDMNLPGGEVIDLLATCRDRWPALRVLVFTMHPEDAYAVAVLRAGASGFLSKDRSMDELVDAVRTVGRGRTYVTDVLARKLVEMPPQSAPPHEGLTVRERQVFDRVVRGVSVSDIAAELHLGLSTVTTYLQRIREKLGVESNFELIQYAFRRKLVG